MTLSDPALLLTRPRAQAQRFADQLAAVIGDVNVVISPVLSIAPRGEAVDLAGYAGVILTSENGARALADVANVAGVRAWCVGDRTAGVAREMGMQAASAGGGADDLVALLLRDRPAGVLLHASGAETRGDIAGRLETAGLRIESRVIYDQVETGLSDAAKALLAGNGTVVLPLFSPRSAALVGRAAQGAKARLVIVALSDAVAKAWTGPEAASFTVADRPDAASMIGSIATIWSALSA